MLTEGVRRQAMLLLSAISFIHVHLHRPVMCMHMASSCGRYAVACAASDPTQPRQGPSCQPRALATFLQAWMQHLQHLLMRKCTALIGQLGWPILHAYSCGIDVWRNVRHVKRTIFLSSSFLCYCFHCLPCLSMKQRVSEVSNQCYSSMYVA